MKQTFKNSPEFHSIYCVYSSNYTLGADTDVSEVAKWWGFLGNF